MKRNRRHKWRKNENLCVTFNQKRLCDLRNIVRRARAPTYRVCETDLNANRCFYCGVSFSLRKKRTVDHIMPKSLGGSNQKFNLVHACETCNVSKDNLLLHDWIKRLSPLGPVRQRLHLWGPKVSGFCNYDHLKTKY